MPAFRTPLNVQPAPRYQPKPSNPFSGNPFNEGLTNVRPNVPAGRPESWGNSQPWKNPPVSSPNNIPSANTGGQIVPANNPGNGNITLPSKSNPTNTRPNTNYPNNPLETWNLNPGVGNGRPNTIPTINVPSRPINNPPNFSIPIQSPLNEDPLGGPVGRIGEWAGENLGRWIRDIAERRGRPRSPQDTNNFENFRQQEQQSRQSEIEENNRRNIRIPYNSPNISNPQNIQIPGTPGMGSNRELYNFPVSFKVTITTGSFVFLRLRADDNWELVRSPSPPFTTTFNISNVSEIERITTVFRSASDTTTNSIWRYRVGNVWQAIPNSGQGWFEFNESVPSKGFWGRQAPVVYSGATNISFEVVVSPSPLPLRNPQPEDDEDMACQPCQAAQALRALQRTVTVDATAITRMPTGDLVTTSSQKVQRVFALPGTEQSIKEQFDLFAEIKKRTAHAFNQARRAKVLTRILQLMNITDFFLNIHNAMMISADIGETFFDSIFFVIDNAPKILDDLPIVGGFFDADEWAGFDSKELIAKKIDELGKQAFGVDNWAQAKAKWAAFNQIVRTGNTMLLNMKDLRDAHGDLAEMAAERIAVVNNALIKSGVIDESGRLMTENVNRRAAFLDKLEKIEESGVVNTAVFFQTMAAGVLDVQETKKDLEESREEFKKAVTDGTKVLVDGQNASKDASQGAASTGDDAKPRE